MPLFGLAAVEENFRRVAAHLRRAVAAYVLGGGAMAKMEVKAATKDVDIAFRTEADREAFEEALAAAGARRIQEKGRETRLGARHLWQTPDGMGWDLFVDNVIGFPLHPDDFEQAEAWTSLGELEVKHFSGDLIFIMKAFTPRTRDIGDMSDLLTRGAANAGRVAGIVGARIQHDPTAPWVAHFYQGVIDLGDERDVDVRWVQEFEPAATMSLHASALLARLAGGPQDEATLLKLPSAEPEEAQAALELLAKAGRIQKTGDRWSLRTR